MSRFVFFFLLLLSVLPPSCRRLLIIVTMYCFALFEAAEMESTHMEHTYHSLRLFRPRKTHKFRPSLANHMYSAALCWPNLSIPVYR